MKIPRRLRFEGIVPVEERALRAPPGSMIEGPSGPTTSPFDDSELQELRRWAADSSIDVRGLVAEGRAVGVGDALELERRRSPWSEARPVVRVIVGRHPERADLLLDAGGIAFEHVRLYLSVDDAATNDLKAIRPGTVWHNGASVGHEWRSLASGDRLDLGPWRFRFEVGDPLPQS